MSESSGAAGLGGIQDPDERDTTVSASTMEDLGAGRIASDDGTDRAMGDHIDRVDRMVGDSDFSDGEPDDAGDAAADDVDFDSAGVEEE